MTIDERIEALTQSVELLASIHKDNEQKQALMDARLIRLESAMVAGMTAFIEEWTGRKNGDGKA